MVQSRGVMEIRVYTYTTKQENIDQYPVAAEHTSLYMYGRVSLNFFVAHRKYFNNALLNVKNTALKRFIYLHV